MTGTLRCQRMGEGCGTRYKVREVGRSQMLKAFCTTWSFDFITRPIKGHQRLLSWKLMMGFMGMSNLDKTGFTERAKELVCKTI